MTFEDILRQGHSLGVPNEARYPNATRGKLTIDAVVETARAHLVEAGDTYEELLRVFHLESGVLIGFFIAGKCTRKQYDRAGDALRRMFDDRISRMLGWLDMNAKDQWESIDE